MYWQYNYIVCSLGRGRNSCLQSKGYALCSEKSLYLVMHTSRMVCESVFGNRFQISFVGYAVDLLCPLAVFVIS